MSTEKHDLGDFFNVNPKIPNCCFSCTQLYSDYDEYKDKTYWYCGKGIYFPTKKLSCKKLIQRKGLS